MSKRRIKIRGKDVKTQRRVVRPRGPTASKSKSLSKVSAANFLKKVVRKVLKETPAPALRL
jgi:hypothetical protein